MTRIGVTGHQNLPYDAVDFVTQGIRGLLERRSVLPEFKALG